MPEASVNLENRITTAVGGGGSKGECVSAGSTQGAAISLSAGETSIDGSIVLAPPLAANQPMPSATLTAQDLQQLEQLFWQQQAHEIACWTQESDAIPVCEGGKIAVA